MYENEMHEMYLLFFYIILCTIEYFSAMQELKYELFFPTALELTYLIFIFV